MTNDLENDLIQDRIKKLILSMVIFCAGSTDGQIIISFVGQKVYNMCNELMIDVSL